ncbi:hypothetical protein GCL60_02445 [Silvanigrella paludirubra]|uniref:Uncharacterized protein n=1 Tax=Silvanigrella paludirubra TaxID=2499159 RepID=A0A6N6VYE9_9BACT|nr:hypothetical protein [Silvanigrella paludirubra]KAB8040807.1 hypothetical protein GCL60_02445 [Silvanigrella paludirubra]
MNKIKLVTLIFSFCIMIPVYPQYYKPTIDCTWLGKCPRPSPKDKKKTLKINNYGQNSLSAGISMEGFSSFVDVVKPY